MPARPPTRGRGAGGRPRTSGRSARRRPRATRRRRVEVVQTRGTALLAAGIAILVAILLAHGVGQAPGGLICSEKAGRAIDPGAVISGYSGEQLSNAKAIIDAGAALGAPREAQVIAVMTAMGESGLRVLDHGDVAGPDSRGLFQQRDNGAWGTYEDRMDPTTSAQNFYRALLRLPGWQSLEPTVAAHRVQRNSDEDHYARYWQSADAVVAALSTGTLTCGDAVSPNSD